MSRTIVFTSTHPDANGERDLVYMEHSRRERGLHVLMQDVSARASGARASFLQAAYRDVVARYLAIDRIPTPVAFLRETVHAFDAIARGVDTRLDDMRELGVHVLVYDGNAAYLLCARDAAVRVRARGIFVPLGTPGLEGVDEVSIETARAQHDLFARTLPDALVLYRIARVAEAPGAGRELLFGGAAEDMAAAMEAIELKGTPAAGALRLDRVRNTVLCVTLEQVPARRAAADAQTGVQPGARPRRLRRAAVVAGGAAVLVVAVMAAAAWLAARDTGWFPEWRGQRGEGGARATHERAPAREARETAPKTEAKGEALEAPAGVPAPARSGFKLAWEKTYRGAVTSSPVALDAAVIFGARDGRVYALDRASGERVWMHRASGGVGASPVVQGDAVIAADYGGNVYRLRRSDGAVVWKRALGVKIVSTPAVTSERVVVGTVRGHVAALSLESGRTLWKFSGRGQIRGGIGYARETFLIPCQDGRLYAVAEDTGRQRWSVALGGPVTSSPAGEGELVVIGTAKGDVVAFDLGSGTRRWSLRTGGAVNSSLLITDGRVFAGAADRRLYCIDARGGELVWRFETSGPILSRPFVSGGQVVVTSYDGAIYCLNAATGVLVDRFATSDAIYSSPVVVDGRVFFGNNDGHFYCLEAPRS